VRYLGSKLSLLVLGTMMFAGHAQAQTVLQPDPIFQHGAMAQPAGDPSQWISVKDYPAAALSAHEAGVVAFKLEIDAAGSASDCTVTASSGSKILDRTTCSLMMRRARFIAGRNLRGEPMGATWRSAVRWSLPEGVPAAPAN
jgi:protein TonB